MLRSQAPGAAEADPHRPPCQSVGCQKIKSFLRARYCVKSPFGNGPDDSCEIREPKLPTANVDVIAHFDCRWSDTAQGKVCKQYGQPPPEVRAILIRELRRLGLPVPEDSRTDFAFWRSGSLGWSVAEGFNNRTVGSNIKLCQVLLMIGPNLQTIVLRELRYQKTDVDVPSITTWSLLDLTDVDGDGKPAVILRGEGYENYWLEVHSVKNGSPQMIFSGLGYYL
jgi:hypothetical protein